MIRCLLPGLPIDIPTPTLTLIVGAAILNVTYGLDTEILANQMYFDHSDDSKYLLFG